MSRVISILLVILNCSCTHDDSTVQDRIDINTIMKNAENQYVYFEDGDLQYYYSVQFIIDDFSNKYQKEQDILQINMTDQIDRFHCNVRVNGAGIGQGQFPRKIEASKSGLVLIELKDTGQPVDIVFGPDDDINYLGSNLDNIVFQIDSFADGVIGATFEGEIRTKTGKIINLKKGKLRVKLSPI